MKDKDQLIDKILKNPTYMPDSGSMKRLKKGLDRLSMDLLGSLDIIIGIKIDAAVEDERLACSNVH